MDVLWRSMEVIFGLLGTIWSLLSFGPFGSYTHIWSYWFSNRSYFQSLANSKSRS
jgi:hypothetical protein